MDKDVVAFFKKIISDPNPIKRGIHRAGIVLGILFASFSYGLSYSISGCLWTFAVLVILARAVSWVVGGFQGK